MCSRSTSHLLMRTRSAQHKVTLSNAMSNKIMRTGSLSFQSAKQKPQLRRTDIQGWQDKQPAAMILAQHGSIPALRLRPPIQPLTVLLSPSQTLPRSRCTLPSRRCLLTLLHLPRSCHIQWFAIRKTDHQETESGLFVGNRSLVL